MPANNHFLKLYDAKGMLCTVMISAELWEKNKKELEPIINNALKEFTCEAPLIETSEPLQEWEYFLQLWDFKYPVNTEVFCGQCNQSTPNWLTDTEKKFRLKSAQLGGLVVFDCQCCGATVRKKHFKDHFCFEFTSKK